MENDATENAELCLLYIFIVYPIIGVMSTKINKKRHISQNISKYKSNYKLHLPQNMNYYIIQIRNT